MEKIGTWMSRRRDLVQVFLHMFLWGSLLFAYSKPLEMMVFQWWTNDMYSYGPLIPFISAYVIWLRRREILSIQIQPHLLGGVSLLVAGLILLSVGVKGGIELLSETSLVVTIVGLVLLLYGSAMLKALLFPISYLLFMIPSWGILANQIHLPFQLVSAQIGTKLLELIGIPVYLRDQFITLPNITLEVAEGCSGVNYLLAVLAISSAAAYLYIGGWPRRIVLVLGSIVVSILTNGLRVGLIAVLSYYELSGDLHGPFHVLQGMSISIVGYAAIIAGIAILSNKPFSPGKPAQRISQRTTALTFAQADTSSSRYLCVAVSCVFALMGTYLMLYEPTSVPLRSDLASLPLQIAEWKGRPVPISVTVFRENGVDNELSRSFYSESGDQITLYLGYFSFQKQGKELVNYKTTRLLEGTGATHTIQIDESHSISVKSVSQTAGTTTQLIVYAYLIGDRVITDWYVAKLLTAWDILVTGRSNGTIFMVTNGSIDGHDYSKQLQASKEFIRDVFPFIARALSPGLI